MFPDRRSTQTVPPSTLYSTEYLLSPALEGLPAFQAGTVSLVKQREIDLLAIRPGQRVLDLGCGRGDVVAELLRRGFEVCGVDYSWDAARLAGGLVAGRALVAQADAVALPFAAGAFDRVLLGDVIEHLPWPMAVRALREAARVTTPGGRILVHTAPNTWFIRLVLPPLLIALRLLGRSEVLARFAEYNRLRGLMHPNELNPLSLRRLMRQSGLTARTWVDGDVMRSGASEWTSALATNPLIRLLAKVAAGWPARLVMGNDLYALVDLDPSPDVPR
ncbi:MAG TPA: class I SAM-dependent methyltransferase [Mycobacteriales bacterium]|nr:class I SAM-dependent methyltransferase [Mycobacteriales bacterium]